MNTFTNTENIPCDLGVLVANFNSVLQSITDYSTLWEVNSLLFSQIRILFEQINFYLKHIHLCHLHNISHSVTEFPNSNNSKRTLNDRYLIEDIPNELLSMQDQDSDLIKYGYNYIFSDKTPLLKNFEQDIFESLKIILPTIDNIIYQYDDIKNNNINNNKCPNNLISKMIKELLTGISCIINYCQDEIYGHTIYIDPNDNEKPQILIEVENSLTNWKKPNRTISWNEYLQCITVPSSTQSTTKNSLDYICTRLKSEYINKLDIDHNGIIYGVDFYLEDCEYKCSCLKDLEISALWDKNLKKITWDDFCKTFKNNNPDDRKI